MKFLEFAEAGGLGREWKDVVEKLKNGPVPRRGGGKNWLKGDRRHRTASHVIEKAKEGLPRIHADDRGSKTKTFPLVTLIGRIFTDACYPRG